AQAGDLDPLVEGRGVGGVGAAPGEPDAADAVGVDLRAGLEVVERSNGVEDAQPLERVAEQKRVPRQPLAAVLAAAELAEAARVRREDDVAAARELARVVVVERADAHALLRGLWQPDDVELAGTVPVQGQHGRAPAAGRAGRDEEPGRN